MTRPRAAIDAALRAARLNAAVPEAAVQPVLDIIVELLLDVRDAQDLRQQLTATQNQMDAVRTASDALQRQLAAAQAEVVSLRSVTAELMRDKAMLAERLARGQERREALETYYKATEKLRAFRLLREAGKDGSMAADGLSVTDTEMRRAFQDVDDALARVREADKES